MLRRKTARRLRPDRLQQRPIGNGLAGMQVAWIDPFDMEQLFSCSLPVFSSAVSAKSRKTTVFFFFHSAF
jgi:hypothetical protein